MWRPLVDIHDVAEAHLRCIESPAGSLGGEIFNVVHQNFQIRQLAMLVAGSLNLRNRPVQLEDAPLPSLNRDYRCTNRKLADRLGFTPHITVLESIEGILRNVPVDNPIELAHPRYYNIAWMTLLEEVERANAPFASVWSAQPSTAHSAAQAAV